MSEILAWLIWALGFTGGVLFFGRFWVQWWVSERQKRSVVPLAFWYMSSIGSILLLTFAAATQSPLGTLSHSLNIVIYTRNLSLIWKDKGTLTRRRRHAIQMASGVLALIGLGLVGFVWLTEFQRTQEGSTAEAVEAWGWILVGVVGQGLFACRFIVQWLVSEAKRRSVIPAAFWYLSIAASVLMLVSFGHRALNQSATEWIFAAGMFANIFLYARNIWFIHTHPGESAGASESI